MKMLIDISRAAHLLRENDNILVLCHSHPDGDTLGCGYALMHILQNMGKRCRMECADTIVEKYRFMAEGLCAGGEFEPLDRSSVRLRVPRAEEMEKLLQAVEKVNNG